MTTRFFRAAGFAVLTSALALGCTEYRATDGDSKAGSDPAYCTYCHGKVVDGEAHPAPPVDIDGGSDSAFRGVGAHAAHLTGGPVSAPIPCGTCHVVPLDAADPGHMDDPRPAEVVFSGLAIARGTSPAIAVSFLPGKADDADDDEDEEGEDGESKFNRSAVLTCENVYCHGATLSGGNAGTPRWNAAPDVLSAFSECGACHGYPPPAPHPDSTDCGTCHKETADGGQIAHPEKHVNGTVEVISLETCDACHGYPPDPPHPDSDQCSACHGAVVGPDNKTFVDESKHRNGTVDVDQMACNTCHGSADNSAPPVDLAGSSDTTKVSVGAHQSHLKASGGLSQPVACEECHLVPVALGDAGHIDGDGTAEVKLGGALARAGGSTPAWKPAAATCDNVYCHGAKLTGGANTTPQWTKVDGTQAACGNCHGISPKVGRHPSVFANHSFMGKNCNNCHDGTAANDGAAIADPALHINGTVDVKLQSGTWDPVTGTCNPACHGTESWTGGDD